MPFLDSEVAAKHQRGNRGQTVLLIGGMMVLLSVIGELIFGRGAFLWIGLSTGLLLAFSPQLPPSVVLRLYQAAPISSWQSTTLHHIVSELARRAGLPAVPALYYVPSSAVNAFAVGNRRQSAIALTDGLLRRLNIREMAGVMAHEISHLRHSDLRVMALADMVSRLTGFMSLLGQVLFLVNLPLLVMGYKTVSWIGLLLLLLAPTLAVLLQLALSRTREFQADLGAAQLTGDPQGLASALEKIDYQPHRWIERIFYSERQTPNPSILRSHPHVEDRIQRLRELAPSPAGELIAHDSIYQIPEMIPLVTRQPSRHWSGVWY